MLTDTKARKLQPGDKATSVGGVAGLSLKPGRQKGAGKFTLRFISPETGKRRDMGLGSYPEISLAQARKNALEARELIAEGHDPIELRRREAARTAQRAAIPTFSAAALSVYQDIHSSFKNEKHRSQWINTIQTYINPKIGHIKVDSLTARDFADALRPIWLAKPETASRVRQRCERIMTWCIAQGYIQASPMAAVTALLPKQPSTRDRKVHHPAVPWRELQSTVVPLFASNPTMGKYALQFLILTAARSGEVRAATWDQIDFEQRVWTVPAENMKANRVHRVPLSEPAMDILSHLWDNCLSDYRIFSNRPPKPLSDMTLTKILRDHKIPSDQPGRTATVHGFRSSFRDWASENGYSRDLAERALAHTISNATEAAYHRTDLLEQRRDMMEKWAKVLTG